MGAWEFMRPLLEELIGDRCPLRYIGRARSSSPSEGSAAWHQLNQKALVEQAFDLDSHAGAVDGASQAGPSPDRSKRRDYVPRIRSYRMTNIVVPELGESVVEARVARWLKKEGDRVDSASRSWSWRPRRSISRSTPNGRRHRQHQAPGRRRRQDRRAARHPRRIGGAAATAAAEPSGRQPPPQPPAGAEGAARPTRPLAPHRRRGGWPRNTT